MKPIRGVLFDMDGTIVDVPYDWPRIKAELGTGGRPILSYLETLTEPERSRKRAVLERREDEATRRAVLKRGMRGFLERLRRGGTKTALVTNNSEANTEFLLTKFRLTFDVVVTRESGLWKPSGAPLVAAMARLGLAPAECCAVGDSHFDLQAAREAGVRLVFLIGRDRTAFASSGADVVESVAALRKRLEPLV